MGTTQPLGTNTINNRNCIVLCGIYTLMESGASNKDMVLDMLKLQTDVFECLKKTLWREMPLVENNSDDYDT